jgi:DNA-binding MarR family transcriptional regulator
MRYYTYNRQTTCLNSNKICLVCQGGILEPPQNGFLIGALVAITSDALHQQARERFAAMGFADVRPAHDVVFAMLRADGDRVVELARRAQMTKQAMGYLITYLELHDYLERVPDLADGRAQIVRRTKRGWAFQRAARQVVQEIQNEWAEQFGVERMKQLIGLLRDLVKLFGVEYRGSVPEIAAQRES